MTTSNFHILTDWRVALTGSDTQKSSAESPFRSIPRAVICLSLIAATTVPALAADAPSAPPLPEAVTANPAASGKPWAFILADQSNMYGWGRVRELDGGPSGPPENIRWFRHGNGKRLDESSQKA